MVSIFPLPAVILLDRSGPAVIRRERARRLTAVLAGAATQKTGAHSAGMTASNLGTTTLTT